MIPAAGVVPRSGRPARDAAVLGRTVLDGGDKVRDHPGPRVGALRTSGASDTGDGEAVLFCGSLPDTSPQFEGKLRQARAGLRVS